MSRISVSAQDSIYIADRIAAFASEASDKHMWESSFVADFVALPPYYGWTETIGLRAGGEVIRWSTENDYTGLLPLDDPIGLMDMTCEIGGEIWISEALQ